MNQITGHPLSANMLRNFERGILLNGCYFERSVTYPFSETTFPTLCCLETKPYIASYCIGSFLQTSFFNRQQRRQFFGWRNELVCVYKRNHRMLMF